MSNEQKVTAYLEDGTEVTDDEAHLVAGEADTDIDELHVDDDVVEGLKESGAPDWMIARARAFASGTR